MFVAKINMICQQCDKIVVVNKNDYQIIIDGEYNVDKNRWYMNFYYLLDQKIGIEILNVYFYFNNKIVYSDTINLELSNYKSMFKFELFFYNDSEGDYYLDDYNET